MEQLNRRLGGNVKKGGRSGGSRGWSGLTWSRYVPFPILMRILVGFLGLGGLALSHGESCPPGYTLSGQSQEATYTEQKVFPTLVTRIRNGLSEPPVAMTGPPGKDFAAIPAGFGGPRRKWSDRETTCPKPPR